MNKARTALLVLAVFGFGSPVFVPPRSALMLAPRTPPARSQRPR